LRPPSAPPQEVCHLMPPQVRARGVLPRCCAATIHRPYDLRVVRFCVLVIQSTVYRCRWQIISDVFAVPSRSPALTSTRNRAPGPSGGVSAALALRSEVEDVLRTRPAAGRLCAVKLVLTRSSPRLTLTRYVKALIPPKEPDISCGYIHEFIDAPLSEVSARRRVRPAPHAASSARAVQRPPRRRRAPR
jgi:hypothetical protein